MSLRSALCGAVAAAFVAASAPAAGAQSPEDDVISLGYRDCHALVAAAPGLLAPATLAQRSAKEQDSVAYLISYCALGEDDTLALEAIRVVTRDGVASDGAFVLQADLAAAEHPEEAVATLEAMARRPGASANALSPVIIYPLSRQGALRARLLRVLDKLDYRSANPSTNIDELWLDWSDENFATDPSAARRAVKRLTDPFSLIGASLDNRFSQTLSGVVPRDVVEAHIADLRAWVARHPRDLSAANILGLYLSILGDHEESATIFEDLLRRAAASDRAFSDQGLQIHWTRSSYAIVLFTLGRHSEALEAYRLAAGDDGKSELTTWSTVGYAKALIGLDRPGDALSVLERYKPKQAYDRWLAQAMQACALTRLGREAEARPLVAELRLHPSESPRAHFNALMCMGDEEGAAAVVIANLNNTRLRGEELLRLSNWRPSENETPGQRRLADLQQRLRQRPDVRAAIAAVGRTIDLGLTP